MTEGEEASVAMRPPDTIRDRLWLWGMKVNVLQEAKAFSAIPMESSTMIVEDAIRRTGVTNVVLAGGLPLTRGSLDSMPSATRVICKTGLHRAAGEARYAVDYAACLARLREAKALATADTRIEGFHLDDFSTGGIDAGVSPDHLSSLAFENSIRSPALPFSATIYTMSVERPELPALLPHFARFIVPLWHADQIGTVPGALSRLSQLSGRKPMLLCLYVIDFGNQRPIPGLLMQRHLDLATEWLMDKRIAGMVICGTCMMDLDWEANRCFYAWLDRAGDLPVE